MLYVSLPRPGQFKGSRSFFFRLREITAELLLLSSYPGSSNAKVHNVSTLYLLLLIAKYSISVGTAAGSVVNGSFADVHLGLWLPVTELCLWRLPPLTTNADMVHKHQWGHTC